MNKLTLKLKKVEQNMIKHLVEAQRETANIVCEDVKKLAPKNTGRYANSIKVSETIITDGVITTKVYTDAKVVSSSGKEYNLGYLLETGTSPHIIEPVNAKALHFVIDGQDIFVKRVQHPGTVAQPHFSLAKDMNRLVYKQKINNAIRRSFNG